MPGRATRGPRKKRPSSDSFCSSAVIGVLNSAISLFYYAKIIRAMYLDEPLNDTPLPVPGLYNGVLIALAVPILVLGLYWAPLAHWAALAFGGGVSAV